MGRPGTDKRLELIWQIRQENRYNRLKCREREQFLYGNTRREGELHSLEYDPPVTEYGKNTYEGAVKRRKGLFGFRLRFLLAVLLFSLFFYAEKTQAVFEGNDTTAVFQLMQTNMLEGLLTDFI